MNLTTILKWTVKFGKTNCKKYGTYQTSFELDPVTSSRFIHTLPTTLRSS